MKKVLVFSLLAISISLFGQKPINIESFYPDRNEKPANYESLIFDPNGWTYVAEYFLDNQSIITEPQVGNPPHIVFYRNRNEPRNYGFTKVKGDKLIHYGDRRTIEKIVFIDEHTLIVESNTQRDDGFRKGKKGSVIISEQVFVPTKSRTIYKR